MDVVTTLEYGIFPSGFRLPAGTHVGAVYLQVSDLPRSLDYYQQVIGLRLYGSNDREATLGPTGEARPLVVLQTRHGVSPARRGALGLYHFAILLPDRAALGRFAAHLAGRGARIGMADHFVSEALYLWDPDGLGIEVYADRPRHAWRSQNGELMMTTDPLDIADVIAAAGGQPWDGIPAGTRMGHVHLSVGSLRDAEAFYHSALGFDKTVWSYPGALFLAAGGYHHHLGTNVWSSGPSPKPDDAQLLEWELVVPDAETAVAVRRSVLSGGYPTNGTGAGFAAVDPWGTTVRITPTRP